MRQVFLAGGFVALVDDEDYPFIARHKWHTQVSKEGTRYAVRRYVSGGRNRVEQMHRAVMDAPRGRFVDHKDHDGLNNLKNNLRLCTNAENLRNRNKHTNGRSKFKGVRYAECRGKTGWRAQLRVDGRTLSSKRFDTEEEAARLYDEWARQHHGEFARLNFA